MILAFFEKYYTVILSVTLILLLLTYWVLIYRLKKLEFAMLKFDKRFSTLEDFTKKTTNTIVDIAKKISTLELIKQGSIKLHANSSMFGDLNIDLDLSKILGGEHENLGDGTQGINRELPNKNVEE